MKKSRPEFVQDVWLERSKSKTGKHAYVRLAFVMDHAGRVIKAFEPPQGNPEVYSKGRGGEISVGYKGEEVLVILELKKNIKGHYIGTATVYDHGKPVYRAKYVKLKLRGSWGDPAYHFFVGKLFEHLKIPVKRENPYAHLGGSGRRD